MIYIILQAFYTQRSGLNINSLTIRSKVQFYKDDSETQDGHNK